MVAGGAVAWQEMAGLGGSSRYFLSFQLPRNWYPATRMPTKDLTQYHPHQCLRCPHVWLSLSTHPTACARCKSRLWDVPRKPTAGRRGTLPTWEVVIAELRERVEALESAVASLMVGQRPGPSQTSQRSRQTHRDGSTLDYDAG